MSKQLSFDNLHEGTAGSIHVMYLALAQRLIPPAGIAPTTRGEILAAISFLYEVLHDARERGLSKVHPFLSLGYAQRIAFLSLCIQRSNMDPKTIECWNRLLDESDALHSEYDKNTEAGAATWPEAVAARINFESLECLTQSIVRLVQSMDKAAVVAAELGK